MTPLWRWRAEGRLGAGGWLAAKRLAACAAVLLIICYLALEATSRPRFCVACHQMRPYYDSWRASRHSQVPCLDCHYAAAGKSGLRRRIGGSFQALQYAVRQYGEYPFTEVDDSNCLRGGCHQRQALRGKLAYEGVVFDHAAHLGPSPTLAQVPCVVCHSRAAQGTHFAATDVACFLCHFREGPEAGVLAQCRLCHEEVKPSGQRAVAPPALARRRPGKAFDHAEMLARGVDCADCHSGVTRGQGIAPRGRCLQCHSQEERLARYEDVAFVHLNHVTQHKVECSRCHNEIEHSIPKRPALARLERLPVEMVARQPLFRRLAARKLYAGVGAEQVGAGPDPMFEVEVTCEACHRVEPARGQARLPAAGTGGCMSCHGEAYGRILAAWLMTSDLQVARVASALEHARREAERRSLSQPQRQQARDLLASAQAATQLVRLGGGVHNIQFAKGLLESARQQINQSMQLVGSRYRVAELPVASMPVASGACLDCHTRPPAQDFRVFGTVFSHGQHLRLADLDCRTCHADAAVESASHGRLRLGPAGCRACHDERLSSPHPSGWAKTHGKASLKEQTSCAVCHSPSYCFNCHKIAMPHPAGWRQTHGARGTGAMGICARCHGPNSCQECHKQNPHPADFALNHTQQAAQRPGSCLVCHQREYCQVCHSAAPRSHTPAFAERHGRQAADNRALCQLCHGENGCQECHSKNPHPEGFALQHTQRTEQRPRSCLACHERDYCKLCHLAKPPSHTPAFRKAHRRQGEASRPVCALCHGDDPCMACHQTRMPHAEDYMLVGHPKEASLEPGSFCYNCHDEQQYCRICHKQGK